MNVQERRQWKKKGIPIRLVKTLTVKSTNEISTGDSTLRVANTKWDKKIQLTNRNKKNYIKRHS